KQGVDVFAHCGVPDFPGCNLLAAEVGGPREALADGAADARLGVLDPWPVVRPYLRALHHTKDFRPAVEPGGADGGFFHARNELADRLDRIPQGIGDRGIDQSERIVRDHEPLWHRRFAVIPQQYASDPYAHIRIAGKPPQTVEG